jgi:hypothetical protein
MKNYNFMVCDISGKVKATAGDVLVVPFKNLYYAADHYGTAYASILAADATLTGMEKQSIVKGWVV